MHPYGVKLVSMLEADKPYLEANLHSIQVVMFGSEVAFDMRRFFAHRDQRAVVMYILGCLRLVEHAHE